MDFLNQLFFSIGDQDFTYGNALMAFLSIVISLGLYFFIVKKVLPRFFNDTLEQNKNKKRVTRIVLGIFLLIILIGLLVSLGLNFIVYENTNITVRISNILQAFLIIQVASLLDWIFSRFLIYNYERSRENHNNQDFLPRQSTNQQKITRLVKSALYTLAVILILQNFSDYTFFTQGQFELRLSGIFIVIFIILLAQLTAWIVTQLILFGYFRKRKIDLGSQYAINQLVKYVIYIIAFFISAQALGLQMTVLLGGLAALLVGVGLGLQQTFNDLFSGIILLFERTVEVGQMIEIDGLVGAVKQIGLRTSVVETRDNVTVIVPNSKLVTDNVINWSHYDDKVRFFIKIGVAYGSDTKLVKETLLGILKENIYVLDFPAPFVRFTDFADSSLNFELYFWSRNFIIIEDIKSDIRFAIDEAFREKDIQIPFPQRDVWIRKQE